MTDDRKALHRAWVRLQEWYRAVEMQHKRALGPTIGKPGVDVTEEVYREEWYRRQRDIVFYTLSLYLMRRAVNIAIERIDGAKEALEAPLREFEAVVPNLASLRDTVEHFDEYDFGEGRRDPVPNAPSPTSWWGENGAGLSYEGMQISLETATPAAQKLYTAVTEFLEKRAEELGGATWR